MDINNDLFKLLKSNKLDEFSKLLNSNTNVDCNIRDDNNNYLIQYAILYNSIDIVELLINKGSKLDIIDIDGRSLLFIPIKYGYNDMLKLLLEKDKLNIGISLLEYSDNKGLFPIHYAILFKNTESFKIIINNTNNIDIPDKNGNTPLHYSIKLKNLEIFKEILKLDPDINYQTSQGEAPLHVACNFTQISIIEKLLESPQINLNIQDYDNQITPLIYSIILDDNNLFSLLVEKSNTEIQDINGNTALHYAIIENNTFIIDRLLEKQDIINYTNLVGKTPLHIALNNINASNISIESFNFEKLIEKSDLNIQDYDGNSCLIILAKVNLWKKLLGVLEKKKLNGFLRNHENETAYDMITEENKEKFLDLLTQSYLYLLRSKDENWKNKIDNICKSNLTFQNYQKIKSEIDIDTDIKSSDKDICFKVIKRYILMTKTSYPIKFKNYCIDLEYEKNMSIVTYTGITLDVLFGLVYLLKNYSNVISTSLTMDFKNNETLKMHYESFEKRKVADDELLNLEIIWNNQNIFYQSNFDEIISKFKKNKEVRFLIIPIGIELSHDSHANILIYDKESNQVERFEPNGATFPFKFNYNPNLLDKLLEDKLIDYFPKLEYFTPNDYQNKIGFQLLESYDHYKTKKIGDPGGFCAAWCSWYAYMRVKYSNIDRKKLCIKLVNKIKEENVPFKDLIRNFASKIVKIRDDILKEAGIDINLWINGNYNYENLYKLMLLIQQIIKEYS